MSRVAGRGVAKKQGARSKLPKKKVVSAKAVAKRRKRAAPSRHMVVKARKNRHIQTGIEATVEGWLIESGLVYKAEYPISRTHVDFYLPETRTVIEVQGCYWHGCAKCGAGTVLNRDQQRKRSRDARRFTFLRNAGYNLRIVWEHEIEKTPELAREKVLSHASR